MQKFLIKSLIFGITVFFIFYLIALKADGYSDTFYLKLCSPKQTSLIIGTSRAAQAIQPDIINRNINRRDLYNFSFTVSHSPFGPVYLKAIKNKLKNGSTKGIFIVTVDPWSISIKTDKHCSETYFEESKLELGRTIFVNMHPNLFYLIKYYNKPYYKLFLKPDTSMFVHDDGWLELNIPMDSISVKTRTNKKIEEYKTQNLPVFKYSHPRFEYLAKTIDLLKKHGQVFVVRLPVHPQMMCIEDELMPDFTLKITTLTNSKKVPYLDLTYLNPKLSYIDGNHIHKESGLFISDIIGNWIVSFKSEIK